MRHDPDRHHRRSIRLPGYDYARAGLYFITLCTHAREAWFGQVTDGEMRLNGVGEIVQATWLAIPGHFPHVALNTFVIMPNHLHGILALGDYLAVSDRGAETAPLHSAVDSPVGAGSPRPGPAGHQHHGPDRSALANPHRGAMTGAGTDAETAPLHSAGELPVGAGSPRPGPAPGPGPFGTTPRRPTLGQVVAYFKYQSTKQINLLRQTPGVPLWQRNYFEHVVRSERSLDQIRQYIETNPLRWHLDRENPAGAASEDAWPF